MRPSITGWLGACAMACALASPLAHAQKLYLTPDAAADALVKAIRDNDAKALQTVLGSEWKRFIPTDDLSRDDVGAFVAAWDRAHQVQNENDTTALLSVGADPAFAL